MTIGSVSSTSPTAGVQSTQAPAGCMTAEGLLLYCQLQLESLGGDIKSMLNEQRANLARKDAVAKAKTAMSEYQPPKNDAEMAEVRAGMQEAIDSLPEGDPMRKELQDMLNILELAYNKPSGLIPFHKTKPSNGIFDVTPVGQEAKAKEAGTQLGERVPLEEVWYKAKIDELSDSFDTIKGDAEIQMILLQSTVSARSTAIQLTTNMLSSQNRDQLSVIGNVGK